MKLLHIRPWQLAFYRAQHWLGLHGMAGVGLLMLLPLLWLWQLQPLQVQVSQLQEKQAKQPSLGDEELPVKKLNQNEQSQQQLEQFYAQFSDVKKLPDILQKLDKLASQSAVRLARGEFRLVSDADYPGLMRYEINLPVQAGYKQVRQFVDAVSREIPTMGLSQIGLKREGLEQAQVEARLDFVLYLRGGEQ